MTYRPSARTSFTTSFSCTCTGGSSGGGSSPGGSPLGGVTVPSAEAPPTSLPVNANAISDLSVPYEALTL